jgi:hypothetical protein
MKPDNRAAFRPTGPWQLPPDHFVIFPGRRAVNFFVGGRVDFSKGAEFSGGYWPGAQKKTRRGPLKLPARPAASLTAPLPKGAEVIETYYARGGCQTATAEVRYFGKCRSCEAAFSSIVGAIWIGCRRAATRQLTAMLHTGNALP